MQSRIAKNILRTIIYYDILNYPLTSFEIWKYLTVAEGNATEKDKCAVGDVFDTLGNKEIKKHVDDFQGFYFLRGRRDLVERRIQNGKNSIAKFKIAERAAWWLRFVPFVRMVAVTGTVAMKNPERDSDIDFLVGLEKGRIFTGRLLVTLVVHLLGRRRYGQKIKNRICLNYFIATGSLGIKKKDLFAANEYSFAYPILGFDVYKRFGEVNIEWIKKFKSNFQYGDSKSIRGETSNKFQRVFESLINLFWGDRIESWLKEKQVEKIKRNPLTYKKGGYVEYSDENLVFLPEPQGPKILEKFRILTSKKDFL